MNWRNLFVENLFSQIYLQAVGANIYVLEHYSIDVKMNG